MAQRIPKKLTDLRDVAPAVPGQVLLWNADGSAVGSLRLTFAALGIWVGAQPPPIEQRVTYAEWLAGSPGYYGWWNLPA